MDTDEYPISMIDELSFSCMALKEKLDESDKELEDEILTKFLTKNDVSFKNVPEFKEGMFKLFILLS